MMDTNETGREPTDDALEQAFERWWDEEGVGSSPACGADWDDHNKRMSHTAWMNGAFMCYTRPMPDTPAPDEAAHKGSCVMVHRALYTQICEERAALTARVAVLEAELAVIEKWASVVEDEEPGSAVSRAFARGYDAARRWVAMWFKNDAAPGKEPTSE